MGSTRQHRHRHLRSLNDLPVEVIAEVVGALKSTKRALSACTLVPHTWFELPRPVLSHNIRITVIPEHIAALRQITQDYTTLANFIKQWLILTSFRSPWGSQDYEHHFDLRELLSLLHGLPSLQRLTLSWVYIFDTIPRVELPFTPIFHLKSLHVHCV
ncbi:hypothetical protein C8Q80DRAFT_357268 [Daedaleopsis nitida]|nr:hypothetical protein C8Q80DRAFT_357268 [Daedaleopsis nitida]